MSHQCYEMNTFEDFFSSQLVLTHKNSRLSSIELVSLPQVMFKISTLPHGPCPRYLGLETKHGYYGAKRNKAAERAKKIRLEDRLSHWASRQMALVSPNVTVCQALKDKMERFSHSFYTKSRNIIEY